MELKSPTKIKIQFRKTILLSAANFELRAQDKYKNFPPLANKLIQKMQINLKNYLFYNNLCFLKYRDAINIYNKEFLTDLNHNKSSQQLNDVTKILLLFFPHLLKSVNKQNQIAYKDYLNYTNLSFEDKSQNELECTIKDFFFHYKSLQDKMGFMFHRREMLFYLESFLINYTAKELNKMKEDEINDMFLLHYFRPFLKPEDYFKKTHKDSE